MDNKEKNINAATNDTSKPFIPLRPDGLPNLSAVEKYLTANGYANKNIGDINTILDSDISYIDRHFLNLAISSKKNFITNRILDGFVQENTSIAIALSILDLVKQKIFQKEL